MSEYRTGHRHVWQDVPQNRKKSTLIYEIVVECVGCGVVLEGAAACGDRDVEATRKLKRMGKVP
jgi:hypothetical protein